MDGRGGCCIARYTGGAAYDTSKVGRIMLRFRPIAPKPAADGSVSGASSVAENKEVRTTAARRKRRYVRDVESTGKTATGVNPNRRPCKKRKTAPVMEEEKENESNGKTESGGSSVSSLERETVITLPLLPEKPERKDFPATETPARESKKQEQKDKDPVWLSFGNQLQQPREPSDSHHVPKPRHVRYGVGPPNVPPAARVVGSWVRVECITGTWVDHGNCLGRTDQEKIINLDRDMCPAFISDGQNRVRWANAAYRNLLGQRPTDGGEAVVCVVMGDGVRLPPSSPAAFTCRVRVVTCGKEKSSKVLLCDVWRMSGGGHAWRLDTEAALSL
nr:Transcription factor SPATULA like [Ipomoea batatas]